MQSTLPTPSRLYRRRQPEKTVLYRAVAHYFETFRKGNEERFQPTLGHFRKVIQDAVYKFLDCGIFEQGFARVRCPKCRHEFLVALSCKLRCICPSCHQKRELLWADWAAEELLEQVPQSGRSHDPKAVESLLPLRPASPRGPGRLCLACCKAVLPDIF